jgi:hypothetical protein
LFKTRWIVSGEDVSGGSGSWNSSSKERRTPKSPLVVVGNDGSVATKLTCWLLEGSETAFAGVCEVSERDSGPNGVETAFWTPFLAPEGLLMRLFFLTRLVRKFGSWSTKLLATSSGIEDWERVARAGTFESTIGGSALFLPFLDLEIMKTSRS